jgi:hypothetical protein
VTNGRKSTLLAKKKLATQQVDMAVGAEWMEDEVVTEVPHQADQVGTVEMEADTTPVFEEALTANVDLTVVEAAVDMVVLEEEVAMAMELQAVQEGMVVKEAMGVAVEEGVAVVEEEEEVVVEEAAVVVEEQLRRSWGGRK